MATLRLVPASGAPIEVTKDQIVVGRDPSCDVVLNDGSVSRKHAQVEKRGEVWAVVDQASANGTFVDSQRVADVGLRHGQELRFGAVAFRVEIEGAVADLSATMAGEPGATVIQAAPLAPPRSVAPPSAPPAAVAPPPPARPPAAAPPPPPRPSVAPPPPPPRGARPVAPGSPVPPIGGGPPPAKKGKGPLFWIGAGCCGCLALGLLVGAVILGATWFGTKGAADAVQRELADIRQGQVDRAYAHLAESYRSQMSPREFKQLVAAHPVLKDNADATFSSRKVENNTATLGGYLVSSTGGREAVTIQLVKEGGEWRIAALSFGGE